MHPCVIPGFSVNPCVRRRRHRQNHNAAVHRQTYTLRIYIYCHCNSKEMIEVRSCSIWSTFRNKCITRVHVYFSSYARVKHNFLIWWLHVQFVAFWQKPATSRCWAWSAAGFQLESYQSQSFVPWDEQKECIQWESVSDSPRINQVRSLKSVQCVRICHRFSVRLPSRCKSCYTDRSKHPVNTLTAQITWRQGCREKTWYIMCFILELNGWVDCIFWRVDQASFARFFINSIPQATTI